MRRLAQQMTDRQQQAQAEPAATEPLFSDTELATLADGEDASDPWKL